MLSSADLDNNEHTGLRIDAGGRERSGVRTARERARAWRYGVQRMPTWDEIYADPDLLAVPEEPEPFVVRALEALPAPRSSAVLDLGCGGGRHLVWLERHGFLGFGSDRAPGGLARARAWLRREGRPVRLVVADMRAQPYPDGCFDAVVAHHVLYHARREGVRAAVAEAARVLRDEGLFVGTLLSTRSWKHGAGERLEPMTYVQERGPEAGVPHHHCDEPAARALLSGFDVDSLALDEFSDEDGDRHSHWQFVATRRASRAAGEGR
jgi:SAM-dependent methyltransferase